MIRYNYNQQVQPPAPFIYIEVTAPTQPTRAERIPALIDIGADITAIPQRLVNQLSLVKFSEVGVGGFRSDAEPADTFLVTLQIHEWHIEAIEVVSDNGGYALLGRDVLNQFLLVLDGPNLVFTIQR
jgi:predicted aspartyl protease